MTISLNNQISAIEQALARLPKIAGKNQRQSVIDYEVARLTAARTTLEWLQKHEPEIKAFLGLPAADRAAILTHGSMVAELAVEVRRREAIAKNGGPVR